MADVGFEMKMLFVNCGKTISRTTKGAIRDMKYKSDEMTNRNKRNELIKELGDKVYALSKEGISFPPKLTGLINQIAEVEEDTSALKDAYDAEKAAVADQVAADKAAYAEEKVARAEAKAARAAELAAAREAAAQKAAAEKAEKEAMAKEAAAMQDAPAAAQEQPAESADNIPILQIPTEVSNPSTSEPVNDDELVQTESTPE